jgi:hypothetical protein
MVLSLQPGSRRPTPNGAAGPPGALQPAAPDDAVLAVRLSDVRPRVVEWLWPQRWPLGKLSIVSGDPGLGKSFLALDAAARLSRGRPWPDQTPAPKAATLLLTAEDGLDDTVHPRVRAMGGNAELIHAITGCRRAGRERWFSLGADLELLEPLVARHRPALVVIDPVTAYLGKDTDSHVDTDVRHVLAPLAAFAARHHLAVVAVMHLNKGAQLKAIYRIGGSIGFVAAARSVFAVVADPKDPARKLLAPVKMNLAPLPPALAFRIVGGGPDALLEWEAAPVGLVDLDAMLRGGPEEGAAAGERRRAVDDAEGFLRQLLRDGPVRFGDVAAARKAAGIGERTLDEAKARLGVRSVKQQFSGHWEWVLPGAEGCTAPPGP